MPLPIPDPIRLTYLATIMPDGRSQVNLVA
jgi:hypothetical protein